MQIDEVEEAIELCATALAEIECNREAVAPIFAKFLLIEVVAKFENKFNDLIQERFKDIEDEAVNNYFDNQKLVKGLRYSQICEVLDKFGRSYLMRFKQLRVENDPEFTVYDGLITDRNSFAHGADINATFRDVVEFYRIGHAVLDYFREALWFSEAQ